MKTLITALAMTLAATAQAQPAPKLLSIHSVHGDVLEQSRQASWGPDSAGLPVATVWLRLTLASPSSAGVWEFRYLVQVHCATGKMRDVREIAYDHRKKPIRDSGEQWQVPWFNPVPDSIDDLMAQGICAQR